MTEDPVIRVRGLRKSYGATVAVGGVDLDIFRGEVMALLGPNGAGKIHPQLVAGH
jgi:ABC-2 type transport system ATP-binding protein